jgi:tetratricopeptide (TPR) repeat protein
MSSPTEDASAPIKNVVEGSTANTIIQIGNVISGVAAGLDWPQPWGLPDDVEPFVGRNEEMRVLTSLAQTQRTGRGGVVALLVGTAGVGKTGLAVHWAHAAASTFPDGGLYVNLRGFDPKNRPLAPAEVLGQFIRSLAPDKRIRMPPTLDGRTHLFRSFVRERKLVIVLDNAVSAEQVRPLLASSPFCVTVVTSRRGLGGLVVREGAKRLEISTLVEKDSFRLLSTLVPDSVKRTGTEADLADIATACAHLPFALRIVAFRLAHSTSATLPGTLAEIRASLYAIAVPGSPDEAAEAIMSWSYKALSDAAARTFRLIGLHPGASLTLQAVAAICGVTDDECQTLLDELVDSHMIKEISVGRFRFHDLQAKYAIAQAKAGESSQARSAALSRVLAWYLHTADAANRVLAPSRRHVPLPPLPRRVRPRVFRGYDDALAWCEAERLNLGAAVQAAVDSNRHEIAWTLPCALFSFFYVRSYFDDWIDLYTLALSSTVALDDAYARGMILNRLGVAYLERREFRKALGPLRESLKLRQGVGDLGGEATALSNVALCLIGLKRPDRAIRLLRDAIDLADARCERWTQAWSLHNLGVAQLAAGAASEARESLDASLAIARRLPTGPDDIVVGLALQQLGAVYHALGDDRLALATEAEALAVAARLNHRGIEAASVCCMGDCLQALGETEQAASAYEKAGLLYEAFGDMNAASDALGLAASLMGTLQHDSDDVAALRRRAAELSEID